MKKAAMGWLPDLPDFRDYSFDSKESLENLSDKSDKRSIAELLSSIDISKAARASNTNLRNWFSPVEDQEDIGSCTANAGVGLVEYFENRAFGRFTDASRLFLYKTTRNLLGWTGDTGAYLRTTMKSMCLFGVPHERYWPYITSRYNDEPSAFCYSFAQNFQAIKYYRLDTFGTSRKDLLKRIKLFIDHGFPSMFGFSVFNSISNAANNNGEIPFPYKRERVLGGHAVVALGYDDKKSIKNPHPLSKPTKGALLIRNSWSTNWGDQGYGWLPYEYILKGMAVDWWSLIKNEWVDSKQFE